MNNLTGAQSEKNYKLYKYLITESIFDMLTNSPIRPTIPVVDLNRAKRFYETTLGLKPVPKNNDTTSGIVIFECGNSTLIELYQRGPSKGDHTVATFEVSNIEEEVNMLRGKGVNFEEYNMPEIKTQNGIATQGSVKAAWFKDSEGNILCIHQTMK
ncbi:MAG TPA: VOC family protein [Nitrososphaeraceae archaeon]|nr:VOC family protein [Nitrososphaeraceae archaeon]